MITDTMQPRRFRNSSCFGAGVTDAAAVICYEIGELHNTDIPDWCLTHYSFDASLRGRIEDVVDNIEDMEDDGSLKDTVNLMLDAISAGTEAPVCNVLWLASREAVEEYYDGTEDNISEFPTSSVILSDLGEDGVLYGYAEKPYPLLRS